jgi:hypothetical protein
LNTAHLGGGPIIPIPAEHEKGIIDLDPTFRNHKLKFRESLLKSWREASGVKKAKLPD